MRDPTLVARVASALERHRIAPARLHLEVTESALIGELSDAHRALAALASLGVGIAPDDFGTGYSTLVHLQRLPADILKIDRSFVAQVDGQRRDRAILAAVIAMAHALGMTVVGEGIETDAQRRQLLSLRCDKAQGYLFAPPLPAAAIAALAAPRASLERAA
jgi:EAL domain-containing protein (putative c-di-GMP-specific phosphodiesterase class I)